MFHRPALPYSSTLTRRREARRLVRGYLGTSNEAAPTLQAALHAAEELKRIIDLASGGRYGLAVVRSQDYQAGETTQVRMVERTSKLERSSLVFEPIAETRLRERALREQHPELHYADYA